MNNIEEEIVPVILVNYNNTEDTAECIRSINESVGIKPFIIIVDNASKDKTKVLQLKRKFSNVHIIMNQENVGFGRANNVGIRWALNNIDFNYLLLLNNDTVVKNDSITILKSTMNLNLNYGIVTPKIVFLDKPQICWYGGGKIDWKFGRGVAQGLFKSADSQIASLPRNVSFASGCAMFIKRNVFESIGGFDSRYFMYNEDVEFCIRTKENGYIIRYEPNALVYHKVQGSMREKNAGFISGWSPKNPNLCFYLETGVHNILLNMNTHAHGYNKLLFYSFFPILITKKIITFLFYGKLNAIISIYSAIKKYKKSKAQGFVNELI